MSTTVVDLIKSLNRSFEICQSYKKSINSSAQSKSSGLEIYVFSETNIEIIDHSLSSKTTVIDITSCWVNYEGALNIDDDQMYLSQQQSVGDFITIIFKNLSDIALDITNSKMDDITFMIAYSPEFHSNILSIKDHIEFIENHIKEALVVI